MPNIPDPPARTITPDCVDKAEKNLAQISELLHNAAMNITLDGAQAIINTLNELSAFIVLARDVLAAHNAHQATSAM